VTCVLYESPHRLLETLRMIEKLQPDRKICCCRELTKLHEEVVFACAKELADLYSAQDPRGEFVLVIEGGKPVIEQADDHTRDALLRELMQNGTDKPTAARQAAAALGLDRRALYRRLLELENE
jgi:16S rRNA (cytidine1402-2'-O)-methyltransferase